MVKLRLTKIRSKLLINFIIILILSSALGVFGYYSIQQIMGVVALKEASMKINELMLKVRKSEKDFLMIGTKDTQFMQTGKSKYINNVHEYLDEIDSNLTSITNTKWVKKFELEQKVELLSNSLVAYKETFNKLTISYLERGFKDFGKEGELRAAFHSIEKSNSNFDKVRILMLRRHEEDFLSTSDLDCVTRFKEEIGSFKKSLTNSPDLLQYLNTYESKFDDIVKVMQLIGLDQESGILGGIYSNTHQIEPVLKSVQEITERGKRDILRQTIIFFLLIFILEIIIGFYLSISFSNRITNRILKLKSISDDLSKGVLISREDDEEFLKLEKNTANDEIDNMSLTIGKLKNGLKRTLDFANAIGNENYEVNFDKLSEEDVLGGALLDMRSKLKEAKNREYKTNWITQGLAKFAEVLREDRDDLKALTDIIVSELVRYLDANQGSIFLVNDEGGSSFLELMACYAWNRKKFKNKQILMGEGLVGRCWQEAEKIYLTDIPEDYISITSGLGKANPRDIIIIPMKIEDKVFGVIEIASFGEIEEYQIEFVEKLAETIASTISKTKINLQTSSLLMESKEMTEELRAQEEEMRQNMEEMQATQEEMMRVTDEKDKTIITLEKEIEALKS